MISQFFNMAAVQCFLLLGLLLCYPLDLCAENIAYQKAASQHGTMGGSLAAAGRAIDGFTDENVGCAVTNSLNSSFDNGGVPGSAWWTVDLSGNNFNTNDEYFYVQGVTIYSGTSQYTDNLIGSTIRVGNESNVSLQTICSTVLFVDAILTAYCNFNYPVRYLSIVSADYVYSLRLCEVEVEGYSITVFQDRFRAPLANEILQQTLRLTFNQHLLTPGGYHILYHVRTGAKSISYANIIPFDQKQSGYTTQVSYLQQDTEYTFQVLRFVTENGMKIYKAISWPIYVRIPMETELPRLLSPPNLVGYSETHVEIQFNMVTHAAFYRVETESSTGPTIKPINILANKTIYQVRIQGLRKNTIYSIIVTPYTNVWYIPARGLSSPPLDFYARNPPLTIVPSSNPAPSSVPPALGSSTLLPVITTVTEGKNQQIFSCNI